MTQLCTIMIHVWAYKSSKYIYKYLYDTSTYAYNNTETKKLCQLTSHDGCW